ncbi:hypothetical protein PAAG_04499 [Paracoccidioides lutzii Pb01]|uniref:TRP C-terminal domain-containing protein n=1 Tax=Paracoccidioides lutzii (strain ATCC MYA-826 / Pb01) TaxID=502779 RepID=C1H155_PARBA|nr:hypothetical protein PAAG_04499 [Paracoccidioides lutzii Pb01]EEH33449.1 hypothetical protein PAAG_04499 [Paracoccidioides lutzii Pb01]
MPHEFEHSNRGKWHSSPFDIWYLFVTRGRPENTGFRGAAVLRLFANSSQSEMGCYSSIVTNGVTLAHPFAATSILGVLVLCGIFSSTALAIYGADVAFIRSKYTHSPSVFVSFSILHHIYLSGALPLNWPSVLVAFWSNFAWFSGVIYNEKMQNAINEIIGTRRGDNRQRGESLARISNSNSRPRFNISKIYNRKLHPATSDLEMPQKHFGSLLLKQDILRSSKRSPWFGTVIKPGLPLPGDNHGFAGTLAQEKIPTSNAFLTVLIWFLIFVFTVASVMILIRLIVEGYCNLKPVKKERFACFRKNWRAFLASAVLRALFIVFFMATSLALFQLSLGGSASVIALSSTGFILLFIGMWTIMGYAVSYRLRNGRFVCHSNRLLVVCTKIFGHFPCYQLARRSRMVQSEEVMKVLVSIPWWKVYEMDTISPFIHQTPIHEDTRFLQQFGWLSACYRRSTWWFSTVWLGYEFIRACFIGVSSSNAMIQVFGLLAVECIALVCLCWLRPFETTRINILMVYLLGFSKVITVALSSLFDPRFNLERSTTTIIGFTIIITQGLLTSCLLIYIFLGIISSFISITRHHTEPSSIEAINNGTFTRLRKNRLVYIERFLCGLCRPRLPKTSEEPEIQKRPSFHFGSFQSCPKIENAETDNSSTRYSANLSDMAYSYNSESRTIPHHQRSYDSMKTLHSNPCLCPRQYSCVRSVLTCNTLTPHSSSPISPLGTIHSESRTLHEELAEDPRWQAAYQGLV